MDVARLVTAAATTPAHEVRMFRLNQWVTAVGSWLGDSAVQVVEGAYEPERVLRPGERTWVGIDVGTTVDSTGVVAMQRRLDDPSAWHAVARIWMPGDGRKVDVDDVVRYLCELVEVAYDPRSFRDIAARLLDEHGMPMLEFPQSISRMAPATATAHGLLTSGAMSWSCADPGQRDLVVWQWTNAEARYLDEGGFRLSKSKSEEKIDAAIALVMCADRATTSKPKRKRSFYGGVIA
jgi:phage terminase large subunit-like protein